MAVCGVRKVCMPARSTTPNASLPNTQPTCTLPAVEVSGGATAPVPLATTQPPVEVPTEADVAVPAFTMPYTSPVGFVSWNWNVAVPAAPPSSET